MSILKGQKDILREIIGVHAEGRIEKFEKLCEVYKLGKELRKADRVENETMEEGNVIVKDETRKGRWEKNRVLLAICCG